MNNYNYNSIVDRQEVEALKEMIFKRARERAEALAEETQTSFTTNIKNDVMELAHDSFVANNKNPFSYVENNVVQQNQVQEVTQASTQNEGIGFKINKPSENISAQIDLKNKIITENINFKTVNNNMKDAREDFADKKGTFIGALDFLNSQASIALVSKKGASFSAIA